MNDQLFGIKEIYDCIFSTTSDMKIGDRYFYANEPVLTFESLQVATFKEEKERADARGGYENKSWVFWEYTHEVNLSFTQGVMSRAQLSFLGNSDISYKRPVLVHTIEQVELDENQSTRIQHKPMAEGFYAYGQKGEKIIDEVSYKDNMLTFKNTPAYTALDIYYYFQYERADTIYVGRPLMTGYLQMTAKTRLKDDMTGKIVTGIINIPKLKLMSDFAIRLGNNVPPAIGNFAIKGFPIGEKGQERSAEIIILEDDIDNE